MSSSNTGSSHKASAAISSLRYLRTTAWCGVTLFAAPVLDRVWWETGASRGCGMATAGVGVGAGVDVGEGANLQVRVRCKMSWAGPPLEVALCTIGASSCLGWGVS